jgi:hypothetical protein
MLCSVLARAEGEGEGEKAAQSVEDSALELDQLLEERNARMQESIAAGSALKECRNALLVKDDYARLVDRVEEQKRLLEEATAALQAALEADEEYALLKEAADTAAAAASEIYARYRSLLIKQQDAQQREARAGAEQP